MKLRVAVPALVTVAGLAIAGAVAYASVPDSGGAIHGCYSKLLGSLRVIDPARNQRCLAGESQISWNQTGPSGAPGPAGPQGSTGPQGPAGSAGAPRISDAYFADSAQDRIYLTGTEQSVASVDVPPGNWAIQAVVNFDNAVESNGVYHYVGGTGICHVQPYRGGRNAFLGLEAGHLDQTSVTLLESLQGVGATVSVLCRSAAGVSVRNATIAVIAVGTLH